MKGHSFTDPSTPNCANCGMGYNVFVATGKHCFGRPPAGLHMPTGPAPGEGILRLLRRPPYIAEGRSAFLALVPDRYKRQ